MPSNSDTENYYSFKVEEGRATSDIEGWLRELIAAAPSRLIATLFGPGTPNVQAALSMLKRASWKGESVFGGTAIEGYASALLLHSGKPLEGMRSAFSAIEQRARGATRHSGGINVALGDGSVRFNTRSSHSPGLAAATNDATVLIGMLLPAVQKVRAAADRAPAKVLRYNFHAAWPK